IDPGDPASGLLPGILPEPHPADGSGDRGLQAYCFRMCLTDDPDNQLPWTAPEGYDPARYELLLRTFDGGADRVPWNIVRMPNRKSDVNNNGAVSTDFIGGNHQYIDANDEQRQQIIAEHLHWQQGLLWTLATHPRVPENVRADTNRWRRAADEFTDNDGWPWRIYVREGRRMISTVVMNENHVRGKLTLEDPIGFASYAWTAIMCTDALSMAWFATKETCRWEASRRGRSPIGPSLPHHAVAPTCWCRWRSRQRTSRSVRPGWNRSSSCWENRRASLQHWPSSTRPRCKTCPIRC
ncbi:MAG: FAD-dependent oxidoreductase, partial [Planctomycetes bacterium]|nr:FAD-dependent oxidoreductase [Planctomycetota bacterium]